MNVWFKTASPELKTILQTLGERYPITHGKGKGLELVFEKADKDGLCEVRVSGQTATIRYGSATQAMRAVGAVLAGLAKPNKVYRESTPFKMVGIMLDCSRNAVPKVDHIKVWMQRLALLGYNMVMLYTEDTYQLPGEPYFGFARGAYTRNELQAIDGYAAKMGIEVIPCIQTLGHLGHVLKHGAYADVRDTGSVMLVGEPKTYALIEKMIRHWKEVTRTKRIHIGMDETHDLGRGRYMDLHGYKRPFDLFNEHLARVVKICDKYELKPMIWSDMYFRLGSKTNDYYDKKAVIPPDVVSKIPSAAELVYWDYYHDDKAFYLEWIERHRQMGKEPLMGSGIWTWNKHWHDRRLTEAYAGPCIEACYEAKLSEIFFTQWGDNGAFCDHDSAFAGMAWCADKCYGHNKPDNKELEQRFGAVCGGSYAAHNLASDLHGGVAEGKLDLWAKYQPNMWDDPLFESHFRTYAKDSTAKMDQLAKGYAALAKKLLPHRNERSTGDLEYAWSTAQALADRYRLAADVLAAYRRKDKPALRKAAARIPAVVRSARTMEEALRRMWLSHNKPEGLEILQGRFGMLEARYREMGRAIGEHLADGTPIVEFEYPMPPNQKKKK